ncbi:hypothetical protein ASG32_21055 [Methylobacterium sp. Leaf361]|uniref:hypothetical protein n=1 Tax=Methylobacterium sp. Leaf361 TaxID=1736352 RepID=UPI0006F50D3D|nr:hypothetical protein [Methylobacterium sp. Leaf361]KQS84439.1 hypothetical protein ASG32_21055 [Methylobacterium sp. Leaf361]
MQTLFTTAGLGLRGSFRRWREIVSEHLVTEDLQKLHDRPIAAKLGCAQIGRLVVTRAAPCERPRRTELSGGRTVPTRCSWS